MNNAARMRLTQRRTRHVPSWVTAAWTGDGQKLNTIREAANNGPDAQAQPDIKKNIDAISVTIPPSINAAFAAAQSGNSSKQGPQGRNRQ
jgi:hypothetical protein